ncbi:MAG: hypothetical protein NC095_06590 [Muribaculum sp.]|nr:hypothetical protein [Muribaculum sp.]
MDKKTLDSKQLAIQLVEKLHIETRRFMEEYRTADPTVVVGAANLYLASVMMQAPSKENAMKVLEADFDVIRSIVLDTPDEMFRIPHVKES